MSISSRSPVGPRCRARIVLASAAAFFLAGCLGVDRVDVPSHRYLESPPLVDVLLLERARSVSLVLPDGTVFLGRNGTVIREGAGTVVAAARDGIIRLGDRNTGAAEVDIVPPPGADVEVKGTRYPGEIRLSSRGNTLWIVNRVNVEEYVAGVVAGEMPLSWEGDALRAQAVAARTFVLNEKKRWAGRRRFDVYPDERSQVYTGTVRTGPAERAASATRGVILVHNWRLFPTFYHSACGGRTRRAFPDLSLEDLTPLVGVNCPFCAGSGTVWRAAVAGRDLAALLKVSGEVEGLEVRETSSGRTVEVLYRGGSVDVSASELRSMVGTGKLRSPFFKVTRSGDSWVFTGKGLGHGIGMCQHGARGMARKGHGWPAILRYYYPGAGLVRVY